MTEIEFMKILAEFVANTTGLFTNMGANFTLGFILGFLGGFIVGLAAGCVFMFFIKKENTKEMKNIIKQQNMTIEQKDKSNKSKFAELEKQINLLSSLIIDKDAKIHLLSEELKNIKNNKNT